MHQVLQLSMYCLDQPDAANAQKAAEQSFMAETIMRYCKEFGILTYFHDVRCIDSLSNRTVCNMTELNVALLESFKKGCCGPKVLEQPLSSMDSR